MANSKRFVVKNGLETQNIQFVELDGTETITLTVLEDGSLSFSGTSGQLFSITDSLTGSIFSVNDISGIPSIEVFDDGKIILAGSSGNVGIGILTPTQKLDVAGNINISSGSKYKINGVDLSAADVGASASNHTHLLAAGATDVTATAAELNVLDGITATTTELNYTDGVTSNIQTQLDGKLGTSAKAADSGLLDGYDSSVFINETHTSLSATSGLAVGWYTIATNPGDRAIGRFGLRDTNSGQHQSVIFYAAHNFGTDASNTITVLHNSNYAGPPFSNLRIKEGDTYQGAALQVYIQTNNNTATVYLLGDNFQGSGWTLKNFIPDATDPGGVTNYSGFTAKGAVNLANVAQGGIATTGAIYADGDTTQYKVLTTNDGVTLAGAQTITGEKTFTSSLVSNVATGTAPLTVTSTTAVTNLNADLLDGNHASAFALASHSHAISDVTNLQTSLDNKVNTSALGAANGVATLDSNSKLNLSQLPIEALDSLKFYSTVSGDVSDLAKRQTLAAELADAYNLSQGSVVGTYFIINAAGTISDVTGIQVVSGDYTGTYVTLSFRNQDSSATQGNANSGALEIGDWFVIEQISGAGTLASPLVFVASVISNTYEDATTAIKGITQLSSSTSTATTGNNVITDGILNGLIGTASTQIAAGNHTHSTGYFNSAMTSNLDTLYTTGQFGWNTSTTGRPEDFGQGINIVNSGTAHNNTNNWITQLGFGTSTTSSYFRTKVNTGSWSAWRKIWNEANDGSGSGLDADKVDNLEASQFIRSDEGDTAAGNHEFYATDTTGNYALAAVEIREAGLVNNAQTADAYAPKLAFHWGGITQTSIFLSANGNLYLNGGQNGKILTTADEGSGNGIDADTLDSLHSTDFVRRYSGNVSGISSAGFTTIATVNAAGDLNSVIKFTLGGTTSGVVVAVTGEIITNHSHDYYIRTEAGNYTIVTLNVTGDDSGNYWLQAKTNSATALTMRVEIETFSNDTVTIGTATPSGNIYNLEHVCTPNQITVSTRDGATLNNNQKVWTSGNDGTDSGLDADLLDGNHASAFALDNTVVKLTGNQTVAGIKTLTSQLQSGLQGNIAGGNIRLGVTTDATIKYGFLTGTHYSSTAEPEGVSIIGLVSNSTENNVMIGGHIYEANPATSIQLYTNPTTTNATGGLERMRITSGGNVGIGTSSPTDTLHVAGAGRFTGSFTENTTNSGTYVGNPGTPRILFANGTAAQNWQIDNSSGSLRFFLPGDLKMTVLSSGNVGIGTASPTSQLEIKSTGLTQLTITGGSVENFPLLQLRDEEAGGSNWNIENGREGDGILGFYNGTGGGNKVAITQSGNVGIGTNTPIGKLDIQSSRTTAYSSTAIVEDFFRIRNIHNSAGTNQQAGISLSVSSDNGTSNGVVQLSAVAPTSGASTADFVIQTISAGTTAERMRILSGGNIGIGNNNPASLLSIGDSSQAGALSVTGNANGIVNFRDVEGENIFTLYGTLTSNNFVAKIGDHGGIQNGTYIGIDDGGLKIYFMSDVAVGVGTTNPTAKLDVNGDVKHTGLTMTTGTNVDQTKSTTLTSALTTAWTDVTGVSGTYLATGSYIVQILSNGEYYTGEMSWFSGTTTTTVSDEIILHRAGPAASAARIFARVTRTSSAPSTLKLQVSASASVSSHTLTFKFRRTI